MTKKKSKQWKRFEVEVARYYLKYFWHFIDQNPNYPKDLEDTLFPPYLELFGTHQKTDFITSRACFHTAAAILKENYYSLYTDVLFVKRNDLNWSMYDEEIINEREQIIQKGRDFAGVFINFLKKYSLFNKDYSDIANNALAHWVLFAVYSGKPEILNTPDLMPSQYPAELLNKLWEKRPQSEWSEALEKKITFQGETDYHIERFLNAYKENIHPPFFLPPADKFQFFPPYDFAFLMEDYEQAAIEAYRKHIKSYLEEIRQAFEEHGLQQEKKSDYDLVSRLVVWNGLNCKYLWEAIPYIPEFKNIKMTDTKAVDSISATIRKSFKTFESFNLPVRPYGHNRKNKASKTTQNNSG